MRIPAYIVAVCLIVLAAAGWLYARQAPPALLGGPVSVRIENARDAFVRTHEAVARIDVQALFGGEGRMALLDPAAALAHAQRYDAEDVRALYKVASACDAVFPEVAPKNPLAKAWLWTRYTCGRLDGLPSDFFTSPPYMHPSGASFVRLAADTGRAEFGPAFVTKQAAVLHVRELSRFPAAAVSPELRLLSTLDRTALAALLTSQPAVASGGSVLFFVRRQGELAAGGDYRVFGLEQWRAAEHGLPYGLVAYAPGINCVYGTGPYCWVATRTVDPLRLYLYGATAVLALLTLTVTLAGMLVSRIRSQRREREDQLFVLRTLTHELRTPATTLGLALETLRTDFDRLPEASQTAFLQMCGEVGRLGRVIAGSTRYLKTQAREGNDRFAAERLPSLNGFFDAVLEPYQGRVQVTPLAVDGPFRTDAYWLRLCLINLVENALQHGKPAVTVRFTLERGTLTAEVQDQGTLPDADLDALARAFLKRGDGGGLGLGLGIVQKTARDLGGSLTLRRAPTTFVLSLKEVP